MDVFMISLSDPSATDTRDVYMSNHGLIGPVHI